MYYTDLFNYITSSSPVRNPIFNEGICSYMSSGNVVHVVGTGTIGEPLIGMLADLKKPLGIDEVTFSKRTPLLTDRSKVMDLLKRGAQLAVSKESLANFRALSMEPNYEYEEAIARASVVIDCTPSGSGLTNKREFYTKYRDRASGFLAQGSEFGFGQMYAVGINDEAFNPREKFTQIVSCNTHNIAAIIKTFTLNGSSKISSLKSGRFVCMRRASDISDEKGFTPAPQVEDHEDPEYGTHHGRDAYHLFKTLGLNLNVFSSSMKMNSQYMHCVWFDLLLNEKLTDDEVKMRIANSERVAVTYKNMASTVFSFGRDHGYSGRILNQTVIALPSLRIIGGHELVGFSFTPQDGNSLLSSIAATEQYLQNHHWRESMRCLDPYLFKEV